MSNSIAKTLNSIKQINMQSQTDCNNNQNSLSQDTDAALQLAKNTSNNLQSSYFTSFEIPSFGYEFWSAKQTKTIQGKASKIMKRVEIRSWSQHRNATKQNQNGKARGSIPGQGKGRKHNMNKNDARRKTVVIHHSSPFRCLLVPNKRNYSSSWA